MSPVKRAIFAVVAFVLPSVLLVCVAEFAVRWRETGGPRAAFASFRPLDLGPAPWLVHDAELGFKLNPDHGSINSVGIRHPELGAKESGVARFVVVGDSVSWDLDGFVARIRARLDRAQPRRFEVVNASVPGYTTHQQRILLERDLLPIAPDLVLLQYCLNDNHRFLHELDESGHWILTPEAQHSSWTPDWLAASYLVKRLRWALLERSRNDREARDAFPWRRSPEFGNAWVDETWPDQEARIRSMRDATAFSGARLAIVVVPYGPQLEDRALALDATYTRKPQTKLREIAERLGVPFLDLLPAFRESPDGPLFRDQIHLTDAGHRIATERILEFLSKQALIETAPATEAWLVPVFGNTP